MTTYEPMPVEITKAESPDGHMQQRPEPLFDSSWARIDQLRWRAGIIKARTGIVVTFNDEASEVDHCWPEVVGIKVCSESYSSSDVMYDQHHWIDTLLTGIEMGAMAGREARAEEWQRLDNRLLRHPGD